MQPDTVRAPNIRDVAKLAGVSYQTVSRVLNDSPSIRESTRQRVLDVIETVGYRPNQAARALVTSKSRTIGVLSSQSNHYGPSTSVTAIEVAARAAGYRLSVTTIASGDHAAITSGLDYLLSQSVEAIVVIAPQIGVFDAIVDLAITVPFVTLEASGEHPGRSLSVDQTAGARMAVRHLIELGHSRILHIAGPEDWIEAEARQRGYRAELEAAGLQPLPVIFGDWTADFGYSAGLARLPGRDFTALFAGNDQMALGFMHACREFGVDVPRELSVVGFDDVPEAAHFWPPLTTVRQDFVEIGRRAIAILLAELNGDASVTHEVIAPELVIRRSTAIARTR
jgi:DNA-binding LacI/PurR family transcriptional regulator